MTFDESTAKYPDLMEYIVNRNALETSAEWCSQLRLDEETARNGGLAEVAAQMEQAQADYGSFPYNSAMGLFLGLELKSNHEPEHGYYMASGVMKHYALGVAQRRAAELIAENRSIRYVLAKDKKTREPIRFATFKGPDQIHVEGSGFLLANGKRKVRYSSSWSVETAIVNLVKHLETGEPLNA
jgi:hypothetical protein